MLKIFPITMCAAVLVLAACRPPSPEQGADGTGDAGDAESMAAATPAPTPVPTPTPTPTPPSVLYTLERVSVVTGNGVVGYPPGQMVRRIADGLYFLDGHEVEIHPLKLTDSLEKLSQFLAEQEALRQIQEERRQQDWQRRQQPAQPSAGPSGSTPAAQSDASYGQPATRRYDDIGDAAPGLGATTWLPGNRIQQPVVRTNEPQPQPPASPAVDRERHAVQSTMPTVEQANPLATPAPEQPTANAANSDDTDTQATATRQYQRGNKTYTVRVKGMSVKE